MRSLFDNYLEMGIKAAHEKKWDVAEMAFSKAADLDPQSGLPDLNHGVLLLNAGQPEKALAYINSALSKGLRTADAWIARGNALSKLNLLEDAVSCYAEALKVDGMRPDCHYNFGTALIRLRRFAEASYALDRASNLRPDFFEAMYCNGIALTQMGRFAEALVNFKSAQNLRMEYPQLSGLIFHTKMKICDWSSYAADLEKIKKQIHNKKPVCGPFDVLTMFDDPSMQLVNIRAYVDQKFGSLAAPHPALIADKSTTRKIRIGYFSADFYSHATSHLLAGFFANTDKSKYEIYAFAFGDNKSDSMTARLKACAKEFLDISRMTDADAVALARLHKIDIAVDLKGFTENARPGIFALRAAPVQVSYLGFPGTMAVPFIDYIVADGVVLPQELGRYFTEKIARLPYCYQANDDSRSPIDRRLSRGDVGLPETGFVFCCFNNNYKITPVVFNCWMRILKRVDGSVLWLLEDNAQARANLLAQATKSGIAAERLVFAKRVGHLEHASRQALADLFLDTAPYNAHTTASDAIWAGLPVLTIQGKTFCSRVAASVLNTLGVFALITNTITEYEKRAVDMAKNPVEIASIRSLIESRRTSSPLFNTAKFTRYLELAFREMFMRHQSGLAPDDITISAEICDT